MRTLGYFAPTASVGLTLSLLLIYPETILPRDNITAMLTRSSPKKTHPYLFDGMGPSLLLDSMVACRTGRRERRLVIEERCALLDQFDPLSETRPAHQFGSMQPQAE